MKSKAVLALLMLFISASLCKVGAIRRTIPFNDGWQFCKGIDPSNPRPVAIPHCWNADDGTTPDYYRGSGIYTKTFPAPLANKNERVFLRFEGASMRANVNINGHDLGTHKGGFTAFCHEITPFLKKENNLLTVTVDNAHDENMMPLGGDFTMFGGIYRPVSLLILPEKCITPLDFASPGVYFTQTAASPDKAAAQLKVLVDGLSPDDLKKATLRSSLTDPDGTVVFYGESNIIANHNGFDAFVQDIEIAAPRLWDGIENPELYTLNCALNIAGRDIDQVSSTVGFRDINIDVREGLKLNGKPHNIRGVNRHQDRPGKGWAISNADHRQDMALIKNMGANGIRLAHYPHSDYFYSLCDQEGMLVWAEIPLIGRATDSTEFAENAKQQLTELIRQNYNHPSIFCWSLFNELCEGKPEGLVAELNTLAHSEDPTRFTTAAPNIDGRPENDIPDIIAYNTYPGWYWADPATMQYAIDWKHHPDKGSKPLAISEYGAGASIRDHAILSSAPKTDGQFHPEEWQATVHEGNYKEIDKRDFLWGTFVWNMFDFASATRHEGDTNGINDKGLATYDRSTPKDAYYFYQANWNKDPMVHITSKRWTSRPAATPFKVYTNCDEISLIINGREYFPSANPQARVYIWDNIDLAPGQYNVMALARRDGKSFIDNCLITINQ